MHKYIETEANKVKHQEHHDQQPNKQIKEQATNLLHAIRTKNCRDVYLIMDKYTNKQQHKIDKQYYIIFITKN